MKTNFLKTAFAILLALGTSVWFASCSEDSEIDTESVENYVNQAVFSLQDQANAGKMGCYEFVFPITINYPDGNASTADSYESLKTQIKEWIKDNADAIGLPPRDSIRGRCELRDLLKDAQLPTVAFPVDVVAEDGTVITVGSREELAELRKECRKDFYSHRGHPCHKRGDLCFKLGFPLTVEFPDGTKVEAASSQVLKEIVRAWNKRTDRPKHIHPKLVFPVTIEFEDGSTKTVNNPEELRAEKESCSQG